MVAQSALADTDEQRALRDTVRRLLRDRAPLAGLREAADAAGPAGGPAGSAGGSAGSAGGSAGPAGGAGPGFDGELWRQLAELGLVALAVPEKYDGLGQTTLETHVVFEEMGRALYGGPYLACVGLAVPALLASGDDAACAELLPGIAAGETVATLAAVEADGRWSTEHTATRAERDGEQWRLTGAKAFVLAGADADLLLVTARTGDSDDVSLFAVATGAEGLCSAHTYATGLTRTRLESLDLARAVAGVELDGVPARLVGSVGAAPALLAAALHEGLAGLAAEQAGGAAACLDMSVAYAKTRQQFGRPIGSFQSVAHKCVDMLHGVEFCRASARYAAAALAEGATDAREAARVAAAYCGEAFRAITVETVHVHGGTGFTWEHDAHLYYRRAWSARHLLGTPTDHHTAIADLVGL